MFCGLASRLAQSLAPKHAVSLVAAHEPQARLDMHAKVAGRPIYYKATLGMMGFASSCSSLQRAPRSNAARSESTSSRCETPVSAEPLPSHARFLPSSHSSFPASFRPPRLDGDAQMPSHRCHVADATSGVPSFTPCCNKGQARTPKASGSCRFVEAMPNVGGNSLAKQSSSSRTCNNRAGRPTKSDILRANGLSAAQSVLSFDCPKLGRRKCEGFYMGHDEQAARPALAAAVVTSVRALRERLSLNSQGSQLKHALVREMARLVSGHAEAPPVKEFSWAVGGRLVCKWCVAAAAHMLMRPSQPDNNVLRLKESMAAAMKLYKQPAGAEVEDVLSSLGVEAGDQMAFASIYWHRRMKPHKPQKGAR